MSQQKLNSEIPANLGHIRHTDENVVEEIIPIFLLNVEGLWKAKYENPAGDR